jgi:hypothetical protein
VIRKSRGTAALLMPECRRVVANHVGGQADKIKLGVALYLSNRGWARGDHRVQCYAKPSDGKKLKGSVPGIRNGAPTTG